MQTYMMSCPKCHSRLKVKGEPAASIRIRCPKCDSAVTVRTTAPAEEEYAVTADPMIDEAVPQRSLGNAYEEHAGPPLRRGTARRRPEVDTAGFPWQLAAWIGGGAAVILCAVFAIVFFNTTRSKAEVRQRPDGFARGYGMQLPSANELPQEAKPQSPVPPPTASQPAQNNPAPPSTNQPAPTSPAAPSGDTATNSAAPTTPSVPAAPTPPKTAAPASQVPVWTPDAKLLEYLGDPQPIPGTDFRVRLPKGYDIHPGGAPGLRRALAPDPQHQTGPKPMHFHFMIMTGMIARGEKSDAEEFAQTLNRTKNAHTDWSETTIERGMVNGIVFARVAWTGTENTSNELKSGVEYRGRIGGAIIQVSATTELPPEDPLYRLLDVSILTFERTPPQ